MGGYQDEGALPLGYAAALTPKGWGFDIGPHRMVRPLHARIIPVHHYMDWASELQEQGLVDTRVGVGERMILALDGRGRGRTLSLARANGVQLVQMAVGGDPPYVWLCTLRGVATRVARA